MFAVCVDEFQSFLLAFLDDFRLTACLSLLKVVQQYNENASNSDSSAELAGNRGDKNDEDGYLCTNPQCTRSRPNAESRNKCVHTGKQTNSPRRGGKLVKWKRLLSN